MVSKFICCAQYTPLPSRWQCQILQKASLPAQVGSASISEVRLHILILLLTSLLLSSCRSMDDLNRELIEAVQTAQPKEIRKALKHGASPDARQADNETVLGLLISQYKYSHEDRRKRIEEAATLLLDKGADANALHHGFTPLQIATGQGSGTIVSRLLTYGADPNLETRAGLAPIWQTVYDNNYKIGYILLAGGANPNARNEAGKTPLQYLRARGYQKTRLMLHLRHFGGM